MCVLFLTRAQFLVFSRHRCDSYMRPSRFIDARTDNSIIVYRVYSSHVFTAHAELRFPFLSTIRSNSLGTTHSFFVTSSIYSFRLVSLSFFISTFFFLFFYFVWSLLVSLLIPYDRLYSKYHCVLVLHPATTDRPELNKRVQEK